MEQRPVDRWNEIVEESRRKKEAELEAMLPHEASSAQSNYLEQVANAVMAARQNEEGDRELISARMRGEEFNAYLDASLANPDLISNAPLPGTEYKSKYSTYHDIAHLDSNEQKLADRINLAKMENRFTGLMGVDDPEETARMRRVVDIKEMQNRSKAAGVEMKLDKPMTEAAFQIKLNKELKRKSLMAEAAQLEAYDYTKMQNLLCGWATISGGVGALETAAYAGLGVLDQKLWADGVLAGISAVARGAQVAKGVRAAQLGILAEKRANALAQTGQKLSVAAQKIVETRPDRYLTMARNSGFMGKVGYDAYRFGRIAPGSAASLASTVVPFSVFGALDEIPFAMADYNYKSTFGEEPSVKDELVDILKVGAFAGAMPIAGKAITKGSAVAYKGAATGVGRIYDYVTDKVNAKASAQIQAGLEKGYTGLVEEAELEGKNLNSEITKVFDIAYGTNVVSQEVIDDVVALDKVNMTETEASTYLAIAAHIMDKDVANIGILDKLPVKSQWMSSVGYMLKHISEYLPEDLQNPGKFMNFLKESGLKLQEHLGEKGRGWVRGLSIVGEDGRLGKLPVWATHPDDAKNALTNMYVALMSENPELKEAARANIQRHIDNMIELAQDLRRTVATAQNMGTKNRAAAEEGRGARFSIKAQRVAYELKGYFTSPYQPKGSLPEKIRELAADLFFSQEEKDFLAGFANELKNGLVDDTARAKYEELFNRAERFVNEFVETKDFKGTPVYNLQGLKGEGYNQSVWTKTADDLSAAVKDMKETLNLDEVFEKEEAKTQAIKDAIANDTPLDLLEYTPTEQIEGATEKLKDTVSDKNFIVDTLAETKAKVAELQLDNVLMDKFNKTMNSISSAFGKANIVSKGFIFSVTDKIDRCEKILTADWRKIGSAVHQGVLLHPAVQDAMVEGATAATIREAIRGMKSDINGIIVKAIEDTSGTKLPVSLGGVKDSLREAIDGLVDTFVDDLAPGLTKEAPLPFDLPITPMAEGAEKAAEEGVEVVAAQGIDPSKQIADILQPLMGEIGREVMTEQNMQLQAFHNFVTMFDDCIANPGQIAEKLLGQISTTYLNTKNSGLSIEALSTIADEWRNFKHTLMKQTSVNSGVEGNKRSLLSWAEDKDNFEKIKEAISVEMECAKIEDPNARATLRKGISQDAQKVAQTFIDARSSMQSRLQTVGSTKEVIGTRFKGSKLKNAPYYFTGNSLETEFNKGVQAVMQSKDIPPEIRKNIELLLPAYDNNECRAKSNLAFHWLENLDLDAHFTSGRKKGKITLNAIRDSLSDAKTFSRLYKSDPEKVKAGLEKICRSLNEFVDNLSHGSTPYSKYLQDPSAKFMRDIPERLFYKDHNAALNDMKYFGYDSMQEWFESDIGSAKKAYAILSKSSADPYHFFLGMHDFLKVYAHDVLPSEVKGQAPEVQKGYQKLLARLDSPTMQKKIDYLVNNLCGLYTYAPNVWYRAVGVMQRILTSPMLAAAPIKSLADYNNQAEGLITMGLAQGRDFNTRARIYTKAATTFLDKIQGKDLRGALALMDSAKAGWMEDRFFGLNEIKRRDVWTGNKGLSKDAPAIMKAEAFSQELSKVITDKLFRLGPVTDYNHSNASMSLLNALGNLSEEVFSGSGLAAKRAQASLGRYGISQYEWESIYSKHCIQSVGDWLKAHPERGSGYADDVMAQKLFFVDNLQDLSDDVIAKHLEAQGMRVSKESITNYRYKLLDKAVAMIETGADELTSIPSARIQGMLSMWNDQNSGPAVIMNIMSQFQSYPAALTFYHHFRRLASFVDPSDPMWNNVVWEGLTANSGAGGKSLMGQLMTSAITEALVGTGVSWMQGKGKTYRKKDGSLDVPAMAQDTTGTIAAASGLPGMLVTTIESGLESARGRGGGFNLQAGPMLGQIISLLSKPVGAATRKGAEGHRAKAVGGALLEDVAQLLPTNYVPTKALWSCTIADQLQRMQYGTQYYSLKRRQEEGKVNWANEALKAVGLKN